MLNYVDPKTTDNNKGILTSIKNGFDIGNKNDWPDTNLIAQILLTKRAIKHFIKRKNGRIIKAYNIYFFIFVYLFF